MKSTHNNAGGEKPPECRSKTDEIINIIDKPTVFIDEANTGGYMAAAFTISSIHVLALT